MRCQWVWSDFGQPVYWNSGLCSCVAGKFVWYVLLWNLLALGSCLVSMKIWRRLMSSCQLVFPGVTSSLLFSGFGLKTPASGFQSYFTVVSRLLHLYSTVDKTSLSKDNGLLFWVPDVLCWHSEVVSWNLISVQMFFWICWGESGLPVLFLHHLRTDPHSSEKFFLRRKRIGYV